MPSLQSISVLCLIITSACSAAASNNKKFALSYVPNGIVLQEKLKEVKIKTPNDTIVVVEFTQAGKFEEASGASLDRDVFVPGQDLLSLEQALKSLRKLDKNPSGAWSLQKSLLKGWYYYFEGLENGKQMDYVVDARFGKLLNARSN